MAEHLDTDTIVELNAAFGMEAVEICQHVANCAHCQSEISEVQLLANALRAGEAPSAEMTEKVIAAVTVLPASRNAQSPSTVLDILVFMSAGTTALAAISAAAGTNVLRPGVATLIVAAITGSVAAVVARPEKASAA